MGKPTIAVGEPLIRAREVLVEGVDNTAQRFDPRNETGLEQILAVLE